MTTPSEPWGLLGRAELWIAAAALASFLVLFWILRGVPPGASASGDEAADAPASSYRDRVIAGVTTGLLLIALGAAIAAYRGIAWSLPVFAMGFGLVLALIAVNDRYRHVSPALRRTVSLSRAGLNTTLVAGTLIVANVMAFRYGGHVIDMTRERSHSLSSQSRNQVESLDEPVVFHIVHGRSALARRQEDRVSQLLELYRAVRPDQLRVERLDRYSDLARGDELAARSPELGMMPGGGVLIEYGKGEAARFAAISNQEMFAPPPPDARLAAGEYASAFTGEDAVTSALIRLRERLTVKIGFTTGHGESGVARPAADGSGIERWKARLEASGCEATPINLLDGEVPKDVKVVVVSGPKETFKPQEAARLKAYADAGGPILACLDGSTPSGLDDLLKSFNLELGTGTVVDPRLNLDGRPSFVFCLLEPSLRHPVTDGISGDRAILVVNGSPIQLVGTKGSRDESPTSVNSRMVPSILLRSGRTSWVESEPDSPPLKLNPEQDRPGPAAVAVAVTERASPGPGPAAAPRPRLVLIGGRSIGDDAAVGAEPTNLDFLMNAVAWLRGREDSIGVPAQVHSALTLVADPGLRWRLILVPTVVAAACIATLGGLVYFVRRD